MKILSSPILLLLTATRRGPGVSAFSNNKQETTLQGSSIRPSPKRQVSLSMLRNNRSRNTSAIIRQQGHPVAAFQAQHQLEQPPASRLLQAFHNGRVLLAVAASSILIAAAVQPTARHWLASLYATRLEMKSLTSGFISGTSDVLCQWLMFRLEQRHNEPSRHTFRTTTFRWDAARTGRFALLSAFLTTPVLHVWYQALHGLVSSTALRVALDQLVVTPLFCTLWYAALWALQDIGQEPAARRTASFDVLVRELRRTLPRVVPANWGFWIPANAINFHFVPLQYQLLYGNLVGFFWSGIASFLAVSSSSSAKRENRAHGEGH